MASTPLTSAVSAFDLTTVFQDIFTVPDGSRAGIDAAVFNNYAGVNAKLTVRLVQELPGELLDEVITLKEIRVGENFLAPGIIGQVIGSKGVIQAKASVNNIINAAITVTLVK